MFSFLTTLVSISYEDLVRAIKKAKHGPSPGALSHSDFAKMTEIAGVDFRLFPDAPHQKPVLTAAKYAEMIHTCSSDEHTLTAFMTPILSAICAEVGANFVNSEEEKWIPTESNDAANFLKPDAFSSFIPVYVVAEEHRVVQLGGLRRLLVGEDAFADTYRFGSPIWELRDIYVIWEFKWKVALTDRGTAYNYVVNMSRDDAYNTYYVLLCDSEHFYIISAQNGTVTSRVDKYAWTTLGAVEALQQVLSHKNARVRLVKELCTDLGVAVSDYLGEGATGRCFSVRETTAPVRPLLALKAVLTCQRDSKAERYSAEALAVGEFHKLRVLAAAPESLPVVHVVPQSLTRIYHNGMLLGVGYLMQDVGQSVVSLPNANIHLDVLKQLFQSLSTIHRYGHFHGDARIPNAIFVHGRQVVWIDLVWGNDEPVGVNDNRRKLEDMVSLIDSIFEGNLCKTDRDVRELLNEYSVSLADTDRLAAHLIDLPQRRNM